MNILKEIQTKFLLNPSLKKVVFFLYLFGENMITYAVLEMKLSP
jgi:hypothetical protein